MKKFLKTLFLLASMAGGVWAAFEFAPSGGLIRQPRQHEVFSRKDRQAFRDATTVKSNPQVPREWVKETAKEGGMIILVGIWNITKLFLRLLWALVAWLRLAEITLGLVSGYLVGSLLVTQGKGMLRFLWRRPILTLAGATVIGGVFLQGDYRIIVWTVAGILLVAWLFAQVGKWLSRSFATP